MLISFSLDKYAFFRKKKMFTYIKIISRYPLMSTSNPLIESSMPLSDILNVPEENKNMLEEQLVYHYMKNKENIPTMHVSVTPVIEIYSENR